MAAGGAVGRGAVAGGVLFALPFLAVGGLPWSVHAEGMLSCALEGRADAPTGGLLVALAVAAVIGGVAVAAATREGGRAGSLRRAFLLAAWLGPVGAATLALLAVLSRASAGLTAQAFILTVPLLDVRLSPNPWIAGAAGFAAGAVGGFVGSLAVGAFVRWPPWKRR